MDVTMLLCDSAQAVGGKLYILGGGWSHLHTPNVPASMALAILIAVPWNEANRKHDIRAVLLTQDGQPVEVDGNPLVAGGQLEVGRPPGLQYEMEINTSMVLNLQGLVLDVGGYVWELRVNGKREARIPFYVEPPPTG